MAVAEFRAALRGFLRGTEQKARRAGLTPQRYLLLLMIKGAADGSERSTVTELVRRAEEAGLIRREPSRSDGRVAHLHLSKEGERRLGQAVELLEAERSALREAFEHLEASE